MAEIPTLTAIANTPPTVTAPTAVTPVAAVVTNVPTIIQNLTRQIEVTGTIAQMPDMTGLVLNTMLGNLSLVLPQLVQTKQDQLLQQLINIFQDHKPVTVAIQPGSPPNNAVLLLPNPPQSSASTSTPVMATAVSVNTTAVLHPIPQPSAPLPGTVLTAIVLPNGQIWPSSNAGNNPAPTPAQTNNLTSLLAKDFPASFVPTTSEGLSSSLTSQNISYKDILARLGPDFPGSPFAGKMTLPEVPSPTGINTIPTSVAQAIQTATTPPVSQPGVVPQTTASILQQIVAPPPGQATAQSTPLPQSQAQPQPVFQTTVQSLPPQIPQAIAQSLPKAAQTIMQAQIAPETATPPQTQSGALKPGNEMILRIISPAPTAPNTPLPPNTILATVTSLGPGNHPIVQTADGSSLYVKQPLAMPAGSSWVVTVESAPQMPASIPLPMPDDTDAPQTLQQVMQALTQIDPQVARQIFSSVIPQPNATLPATLLFFFDVLKQGTPRGWLGDDVSAVLNRAGKAPLIAKLVEEMRSTGSPVQDDVVGEWKSYPVPLFADGRFQTVPFYVHNNNYNSSDQHSSAARKAGPSSVRFLIDLRMSRLGPLQLDGLIYRHQFDMIIRSEQPLPGYLTRDLQQTYSRTLEAINYAGNLIFQTGRRNWLILQKPTPGAVIT